MCKSSSTLALMMAAALAACGSKASSSSTVASALDYCTSMSTAITDGLAKCENWSSAAAAMVKSQWADTCKSGQKVVDAKRVAYDTTKGTACVNAIKAIADCTTLHEIYDGPSSSDSSTLERLAPACSGVLTPEVKVGDACYDSWECASGWCDESNNACPGTCKAAATEGQDCGQMPCAKDLKCWYAFDPGTGATTQACQKPVGAGQDCSNAYCADGLDCDGSSLPPTCVAERGPGDPCASVGCKWGLYCDSATSQCATPKTSGACNGSKECAEGYECAYSNTTQSASCKKTAGLDDACTTDEYTCGWGYYCEPATSKCAKTPAIGEACDSSSKYCLEGYCDSSTSKCAAFKAVGEPCDPAVGQCGYTAYCDGTTSKCTRSDSCSAP